MGGTSKEGKENGNKHARTGMFILGIKKNYTQLKFQIMKLEFPKAFELQISNIWGE